MYDYGARMLMPDLGRWGAMDAMSEKYSAWSPYNYAINNPVMVIDPDGNDVINTGAGMTATGADAQFAFKAYVATMSTSTESSGGNIFTGFDFNSLLDDITVDYRGKIIKIDANNKPNRFFDEKGSQLFLNDPTGVDADKLKPGSYVLGEQLYHRVNKGILLQFMKSAGFDALRYNMKAQIAEKQGNLSEARNHKITALGIVKQKSYKEADFAVSSLGPKFIYPEYERNRRRPWLETLNETTDYFRLGDSNVLYNLYDAGNYLWGSWMYLNGFNKKTIKFGSNFNEYMRGNMGDTVADQRSMFNGFDLKGFKK
ncbi:RHS repeat-associated protein [Chryseobacterium sp. CBTAP 102]|nr:RHS repeat-associated protein [Chryseobacterium sp. CBTAP 102]